MLLHERKHDIVYIAQGIDADPWASPLGQHQSVVQNKRYCTSTLAHNLAILLFGIEKI